MPRRYRKSTEIFLAIGVAVAASWIWSMLHTGPQIVALTEADRKLLMRLQEVQSKQAEPVAKITVPMVRVVEQNLRPPLDVVPPVQSDAAPEPKPAPVRKEAMDPRCGGPTNITIAHLSPSGCLVVHVRPRSEDETQELMLRVAPNDGTDSQSHYSEPIGLNKVERSGETTYIAQNLKPGKYVVTITQPMERGQRTVGRFVQVKSHQATEIASF